MIIIFLAIYILSAVAQYRWVQLARFHEKGIFRHTNPEGIDVLITLFPGVNTVFSLVCWLAVGWKDERYRSFPEKFFSVGQKTHQNN